MKKPLFIIGLLACNLIGCTQFEEPELTQEVELTTSSPQTRAEAAATFTTLPDPFSLANMQEVYDTFGGNRTLQTTDLYVRFKPQNIEQINLLEDTYDLDLFDYPLDLDIPDGVEYVDPTIPTGQPIWYYTTVKPNFVFPSGIPYEIIRQCYIPADNEVINVPPGTRAGESGMIEVEWLALKLLGYIPQNLTRSGGGGAYYPEGTVTVLDNSASPNANVAVKGVRVKVNSLTKINKVYTNAAGYYKMTQKFWQENLKYKVVFKNTKNFILWEGLGNRAKYKPGRHHKSGWDIAITDTSSHAWQWAAVNNAAYDYYEMCSTTGISAPPSGLRIWVQPNASGSSAPMIRRVSVTRLFSTSFWVGFFAAMGTAVTATVFDTMLKFLEPDLTIGTNGENYDRIVRVVNHELSHASHFSKVGAAYWARYIGYIIDCGIWGGDPYGNGTKFDAGLCAVGEMWGYAMGDIAISERYNSVRLNDPYVDDSYGFPYDFRHEGINGWLHPDPIWALITRGILTKRQVFDCLTSDVDTVDKLINKLCVGKSTAVADVIRTAFAHNDVPIITGPDKPALNTYAIYSVPANMADDFDFIEWTVTPSTGVTISSQNSPTTTIKFQTATTYTLTANFTLPGNVAYAATKTIDLSLPPTPVISANVFRIPHGQSVRFSVNSPVPGTTYEWEANGSIVPGHTLSYIDLSQWANNLLFSQGIQPYVIGSIMVRCRARNGSIVSAWSNYVNVIVY